MWDFKQRLELAILQGAALAALSISGCSADGESSSVKDTSASGGEPSTSTPAELEPYSSDALACSGMDYGVDGFGYHGQCCAKANCYTPDDGVCASAETAPEALGLSFGSGKCLCAPTDGEDVTGPFAPNPADTPATSGSCCYVIASISCDGRPLLVGGVALVASPIARGDWIAAELRQVRLG